MNKAALDRRHLPAGTRVLCAVSGGADSVCLLHLLHGEEDLEVLAAHYNHCLRGTESDGDEAFVRELCADWGIPFYAGRGDVAEYAKSHALSLEAAARTLRYAFLEETAEKCAADVIVTAHTASDNTETVLLHLARGAGLRGLGGIAPRRGKLLRPLLGMSREDVEDYLHAHALPHREDSSNALDDAARNRLRHHAIPALKSVNGALDESVGRMTALLRRDEEALEQLAGEAWQRLWDGEGLSVEGLRALPEALAFRLLRRLAGESAELVHLEALWALCTGNDPSGETVLPGGRRFGRVYDRLGPVGDELFLPERQIVPGQTLFLPEAQLWLRAQLCAPGTEIQKAFNTFSFSCASICGRLTVASRTAGESIAFGHREGTHSLKKLMTDAHIPRRERGLVPVIRDEAGVLAVYGFGQARRAAAREGEEVLRITIYKKKREEQDP